MLLNHNEVADCAQEELTKAEFSGPQNQRNIISKLWFGH